MCRRRSRVIWELPYIIPFRMMPLGGAEGAIPPHRPRNRKVCNGLPMTTVATRVPLASLLPLPLAGVEPRAATPVREIADEGRSRAPGRARPTGFIAGAAGIEAGAERRGSGDRRAASKSDRARSPAPPPPSSPSSWRSRRWATLTSTAPGIGPPITPMPTSSARPSTSSGPRARTVSSSNPSPFRKFMLWHAEAAENGAGVG